MLLRSLLLLGVCLVTTELLSALPLDRQETLLDQEGNSLPLESSGDPVVRDKRTIGFLRQAFPTVSQIIDRKIQAITRLVFRIIGRLVLRGGAGGGGGGDSSSEEGRVQITLPTFPPLPDDEEEETDDDSTAFATDDSTTTTIEPSDDENAVGAESKLDPVVVRKVRQALNAAAEEEEEYEDDDQAVAASDDNEVAQGVEDEIQNTASAESENTEDDPRNKRFLNLGGGGGGSSGGGSGNFLFDIIRLVAGSGATQTQDEAENAPQDENATETTGKAEDNYGAGVPGPLTRLFVIANRGIANLIQDLILRLAQTSERIVNFKARLITSII